MWITAQHRLDALIHHGQLQIQECLTQAVKTVPLDPTGFVDIPQLRQLLA